MYRSEHSQKMKNEGIDFKICLPFRHVAENSYENLAEVGWQRIEISIDEENTGNPEWI